MRHLQLFAALALIILVITGCGPDTSSGGRPLNPAADVSRDFDTFSIKDEEGLPAVLPNTIFYDFYRGLEPAEGEGDQGTATEIRELLDALMGLTDSDDDKTTYEAARNPIDFLNFVIDSNQVGNFNEGRQLIHGVIIDGVPAFYNTPQNNAIIRFTETEGDVPESDQLWVYPLLDWRNNPGPGTVVTSRQFVARTPADESEPEPEIESMQWSARIKDSAFSVSGYNQPDFEVLSITTRSQGNADLQKEYINSKTDTFSMARTSARSQTESGQQCQNVPPEEPLDVMIAGKRVDCIRVEIDYPDSQVRVFSSRGEAPVTEDCSAFNANYCGNQRTGNEEETLIYDSIAVDTRQ